MVIWVHRRLGSKLRTEEFVGSVGNYLVGVHIRLRAGAGLPDHEREVVYQFQRVHISGGLLDCFAEFGICKLELMAEPKVSGMMIPRTPWSTFTLAAEALRYPNARMRVGGMRSRGWLTGKFCRDLKLEVSDT